MKQFIILLYSLGLLLTLAVPGSLYAMGEWNIYNATPQTTRLQTLGNRLYTISGQCLCSYSTDAADDDFQRLSRITGLSGSSVQFIQTIPDSQCMAIAYADGNIDLMYTDGSIVNIPDLANKPMAGDKTLLSLNNSGNQLFASGGFGFIVIDLSRQLISQSYLTRFPVRFAFQWGDRIYRYSDKKFLEYGEKNQNLAEEINWHLASNLKFSKVLCSTDSLTNFCWLLGNNGHLYQLDKDQQISVISDMRFTDIFPVADKVFLTTDQATLAIAEPATLTITTNHDDPFYKGIDFTASDQEGHFFMLMNNNSVYRMSFDSYIPGSQIVFGCDWENTLQPEGIATYFLGEMKLNKEGIIGISRRSYIQGLSAAHALEGIFTHLPFDEAQPITNVTRATLIPSQPYSVMFQGLTGLAIDPMNDEHCAISTALYGVYILDHDTLDCILNQTNTQGGIEAFANDFPSTRTSAVAYDDQGNLFVTCSMQDTILRCLTTSGKWIKYPNSGMSQVPDARRILISRNDPYKLKWVLNDYGFQKSRVGIYYDKGTPSTVGTSDYQTAWFTILVDQDLNEYLPHYIYDLCEDLDGKIWVLTDLGPFVIEDTRATFEYAQNNPGKGKVRRVKIPRNDGTNLADYLMEATYCTCMAIDNYNRKWIGTNGAGLYLLSADCITEIEHFSCSNSPLLSDDILDLCYDAESGKIYISCEGGILSYQTDAIEGEDDFESIYCYPNPIRPEYSGELRIMGLMNDSQVSITTTDGTLIYRTQSQGATTTWDLRTESGSRINPGIYLIHGVNTEGKKGKICKFLVL